MAQGRKTGGRQKGTPNKDNPLKGYLRAHSMAYFEPGKDGMSQFDQDMAKIEDAAKRVELEEKLLQYHTPKMQSVSAEVSVNAEVSSLEIRLAQLAADNS